MLGLGGLGPPGVLICSSVWYPLVVPQGHPPEVPELGVDEVGVLIGTSWGIPTLGPHERGWMAQASCRGQIATDTQGPLARAASRAPRSHALFLTRGLRWALACAVLLGTVAPACVVLACASCRQISAVTRPWRSKDPCPIPDPRPVTQGLCLALASCRQSSTTIRSWWLTRTTSSRCGQPRQCGGGDMPRMGRAEQCGAGRHRGSGDGVNQHPGRTLWRPRASWPPVDQHSSCRPPANGCCALPACLPAGCRWSSSGSR